MEDIILLLVNDKRMKDILTYPVLIEVCDIIDKMYQLGWDERNGGNVSYLLDENELSEYLDLSKVIRTYSLNFDASELKGKYFYPQIKLGDSITKGQLLMKFDLEKIKESGYDTVIPIIITDTKKDVEKQKYDNIKNGDLLLTV